MNGEKVRLVRLAYGIPQNELAKHLGLKQPNLSEIEAGQRPVPEHVATSMQFLSGFSSRFFSQPIKASVPAGNKLLFRKSKNKYRESDGDQAYCQLVFDTFEPLTANLTQRSVKFSRVKGRDLVHTAEQLRNVLGVRPGSRIENPVFLAEMAGVRVIGIKATRLKPTAQSRLVTEQFEGADEFQAFSFWSDRLPVLFLNTAISPDRMNWALVHDLVHLMIHDEHSGDLKKIELEAQEVTKEVMLPAAHLNHGFRSGRVTLDRIMNMALIWNVSPASIVYRASELGLLPSKGYFLKCVSDLNFSIKFTKPRFYRQMCEVLFGRPLVPQLSRELGVPKEFVRSVLKGHSGDDSMLE